ncbi:MAG TPA: VIT family protein [Polyangiaceae bacterium]
MADNEYVSEQHRSGRNAWLRAAVLGADDGVVSTASLMLGVAATSATRGSILIAGVAGMVAGAMSMAAGEYVSVASQRDTEEADIVIEKRELATHPNDELRELAGIYRRRGLDPDLALEVARQLSRRDRLGAHLRDELGLDPKALAKPLQAAVTSAVSFASMAAIPIVVLLLSPEGIRAPLIAAAAIVALAILGAIGAQLGGASLWKGAIRVAIGGGLAMATTTLIGKLLGVAGL